MFKPRIKNVSLESYCNFCKPTHAGEVCYALFVHFSSTSERNIQDAKKLKNRVLLSPARLASYRTSRIMQNKLMILSAIISHLMTVLSQITSLKAQNIIFDSQVFLFFPVDRIQRKNLQLLTHIRACVKSPLSRIKYHERNTTCKLKIWQSLRD